MTLLPWLFLRIAKPISVAVIAFSCMGLLTSCTPAKHYRSYLFEEAPVAVGAAPPQAEFVLSNSNTISVTKGTRVKINLSEVRIGFVHRDMEKLSGIGLLSDHGPYYKQFLPEEGLGGKELWLLAVAIPKDPTDPLGLKAQQLVYASSIKLDQESFSFLPLDENENKLLDVIANTSYQIDFRAYSVHGVQLKRALLLTAQSSIGAWVWSSLKILSQSMVKFLGEGIFTDIEGKAKQPLFFEQILLEANAELELHGLINLIAVTPKIKDADKDKDRKYVLYDIVKSEIDRDVDGKIDSNHQACEKPPDSVIKFPKDMIGYVEAYKCLHFHKPRIFQSSDEAKRDLQSNTNSAEATLDELAKSYVFLTVTDNATH